MFNVKMEDKNSNRLMTNNKKSKSLNSFEKL